MNEREIFAGALALNSDEQRAAFLEEACGEDDALKARIETLLRNEPALGSFLEHPAAPVPATAEFAEAPQIGTVIGPYKLLQKLGEGGMGVVYMAEQRTPVERRVALKIIKAGMDTEQVIARFEAERQALAMMEHQNIARVLDAGATETGRPYFVMELVKGVPITEYCDHNKLTTRDRLELFLPVCLAIQHAHQKGVIHRDIKPSNIMVTLYDGRATPKIIDFGVAKATAQRLTEKTMFTLYGQIVGTLEYMSPEQAEMSALDIDTRSDVYSLGVVLYELLTGSTPLSMKQLRKAALPEMLRMIREHEPERPSTRLSHSGDALPEISAQRKSDPQRLSALIRGEIDWIVLKALEKDRARRYATASGLAEDIQRYLADEPVEACPPSTAYRLRKQLRKHRGLVMAGGAVFISLIAGLCVSVTMYFRAEASRQEANLARQNETKKAGELRAALSDRDTALRGKTQALGQMNAALRDREAALSRSESSRLAALSSAALGEDPGLALVLAVESASRDERRTATQNNVLRAALARCRETQTLFVGHPAIESIKPLETTSAKFTSGGLRIVTLAKGERRRTGYAGRTDSPFRVAFGLAQVWTESGELLASIEAPPRQTFAGAEVSADGRWLVGYFENSSLTFHGKSADRSEWTSCLYSSQVARVWNLESGQEIHVLRGHANRLSAARFDRSGERIVTACGNGVIRIWDAVSGKELRKIDPKGNAISDAKFTPSGDIVASFPGAVWTTTYEGANPEAIEIGEVDPPFDPERPVVKVNDGERGRTEMRMQFSGPVNVPLPPGFPFSSTGKSAVRVWSGATFQEIPLEMEDSDEIKQFGSLTVLSDPERAVFTSQSGEVFVYSLPSGEPMARFSTGLETIADFSVSPDGRRTLCVAQDGAMAVHQLSDGAEMRRWDARQWQARSACFGANGELVLAVHDLPPSRVIDDEPRGQVVMLSVTSGEKVGWLKGHGDTVQSVRPRPDGSHVVTASLDGTARVWRADLQSADATVLRGSGPIPQAVFTPEGQGVLVANGPANSPGWRGFGQVYNLRGQPVISLAEEGRPPESELVKRGIGAVRIVQFSNDGKRVLTVSDDRHIRAIDPAASLGTVLTMPSDKWPVVEEMPYTPVRIWDAASGCLLLALEGLENSVCWAAFTPDGERIITLTRRHAAYVDIQIQEEETKEIMSGSGNQSQEETPQIHVWDARSGDLLLTLRDLLNPHQDLSDHGTAPLAISPDGRLLVITQLNGYVDLQEMKRYTLPGMWSGSTPLFSPDGWYLLTYSSREATVTDLTQLKSSKGRFGGKMEVVEYAEDGRSEVKTIPMARNRRHHYIKVKEHTDNILSASFSPDGSLFATASADRTVQVRRSEDAELQCVLRGHRGPVRQAVFSPNGQWIATRDTSPQVRIFRADDGGEVATFRGHHGNVRWVEFAADSQSLLTAAEDGTARLWPIDPLPDAIRRLPRKLTKMEAARYGLPNEGSPSMKSPAD